MPVMLQHRHVVPWPDKAHGGGPTSTQQHVTCSPKDITAQLNAEPMKTTTDYGDKNGRLAPLFYIKLTDMHCCYSAYKLLQAVSAPYEHKPMHFFEPDRCNTLPAYGSNIEQQ